MELPKTMSNRPDSLPTTNGTDQLYIRICIQCQQRKRSCKGWRPGVSKCDYCSTNGQNCVFFPEEQQKASRPLSSDDGERELPLKRTKMVNPSHSDEKPKLACPYYQRNPETQRRPASCTESSYPDIRRLRQHLERVHQLPPHCPRCFGRFNSEMDVQNHLQAEKACQPNKPLEDWFGYNKAKELLLNKKTQRGGTDREKWREIYKILFPRDPECRIPDPYRGDRKAVQTAPDNAQREQHIRNQLQRIMEGLENLIVEEYGQLDPEFRAKLSAYVLQSQDEVCASLVIQNKSGCRVTRPSPRPTNTDKPPVPSCSATNLDAHPNETNVPSWAMDQGLKDGVDTSTLQKVGMYDTSSLLPEENHQSELARDRDSNSHQANSKLVPQVGAKSVQYCNPFRHSPTSCSRSSQPSFLPGQNLQVGNAAEANLPNPAPVMQDLQPAYSTSIHGGATPPSGFMSSTPSTNPFLSSPDLDYRSSRQSGTIQSLNQHDAGPQWDLDFDWDQIYSESVI